MECATNVNDLRLHNSIELSEKLDNASSPSTKPVDGETPCGVDMNSLPFCEDDVEDEIFFGQVSSKEHRKAQKFEHRQTALFVQEFRSDRRLMRYTIDMRRSQCNIGNEGCGKPECETKSTCGLSSICEENNDQPRVNRTSPGTEPGKCWHSFVSQTGHNICVGEKHLKPESVSPITGANATNETGHEENKANRNSEVVESERNADAGDLLHFFASVCALQSHQNSCETTDGDEIAMMEDATRDTEHYMSNGNGDTVTNSDTLLTDIDEAGINDASRTEDKTGDDRVDRDGKVFDSDDSDVVIINVGHGHGDEADSDSCDTEVDTSELEVDHYSNHVGGTDTSMNDDDDDKINVPGNSCINSRFVNHENETGVTTTGCFCGKTNNCDVMESEINKGSSDLESKCIRGPFKCDSGDEVTFAPGRRANDTNAGDCSGEGSSIPVSNGVNSITRKISEIGLNTEYGCSDESGREVVSDVTTKTINNIGDTKREYTGHGIRGSVAKSSDAIRDITELRSIRQPTTECSETSRSNSANIPDFSEQSNIVNTPVMPAQQIHNTCCSAFQTYQKREEVTNEDSHSDFPKRAGKNGSKEVSVKLDFDNVLADMDNARVSSISPEAAKTADLATSFTCVTPTIAPSEFSALPCTSDIVETPHFVPPTPHTTSVLMCPSVCGRHVDSVMGNQGSRGTHPATLQGKSDSSHEMCSNESSDQSLCFGSPALAQDMNASHDHSTRVHSVTRGNNLTKSTNNSCQSMPIRSVSSRTFTPTVLTGMTKVVAMVTPTVTRSQAFVSPGVIFTERHFSPTPVSVRQFHTEALFSGNICPSTACAGMSEDDDIVPPTPKMSDKLSCSSVTVTEKHYSCDSVDDAKDRCNHGDTVDAVCKSNITSEGSPQIVFKVHNFSPVVVRNDALLRRVPSCEKTCGSTKCEHCTSVVHGIAVTSPYVTGKGRSMQRINRLKLKKANSIRKASVLSPCKKAPIKPHPDGSTATQIRSKLHSRPSPFVSQTNMRTKRDISKVLSRTPRNEGKSCMRQVKEGLCNPNTPSNQLHVYRQGTPKYKVGSPRSKLTKVTRLPSPWGQGTPTSVGRQQPKRRTESDDWEVTQNRSQLKQSHRDKTEPAGKVSTPRGALRTASSPGVPKMLRMYDSPMTPTSADNLPRVRYKEKGLNQVQLDAITQLHTLCNSQQAVRYISRPRIGGAVKRVPGKVCSRLSWQEDTLSTVPEDKHAPPSLDQSPSPKSILHVKPLTQLYPYSDEPLSPVVIHKTVRKTNTLAQAANKG